MSSKTLIALNENRNKCISVNIPFSKSISNRLLIIRHLAKSEKAIDNLSDSEDTALLQEFLSDIRDKRNNIFFCKNAGTTTRFLIALLCMEEGTWTVQADERMNQRPVLPLIKILQSLGAETKGVNEDKIFPLLIRGRKLKSNGRIVLENNLTSQIISALLLISPYIKGGLELKIPKDQVSFSYIEQTIALANHFGAKIEKNNNTILSLQSNYHYTQTSVEKDYSSLCFVLSFICTGKFKKVTINGLTPTLLQGESRALDFFSRLGLEYSFKENHAIFGYNESILMQNENSSTHEQELLFNMKDCPDVFLPLAVTCYCLGVKTRIINLGPQRVKESNRLENIAKELNKMGKRCFTDKDSLIINPSQVNKFGKLSFSSYNDHRMVMALSAVSLIAEKIEFDNVSCVDKSWKNFFEDMKDFIRFE